MIGTIEERLGIRIAFCDGGGEGSSSSDTNLGTTTRGKSTGMRNVSVQKTNRNGTKTSVANTAKHIAVNSGAKISGGSKGASVSISPNCGGCHDPYNGGGK